MKKKSFGDDLFNINEYFSKNFLLLDLLLIEIYMDWLNTSSDIFFGEKSDI